MASCSRDCENCPYERDCKISCTELAIYERLISFSMAKLEHGTLNDGIPGMSEGLTINRALLKRHHTNRLYENLEE